MTGQCIVSDSCREVAAYNDTSNALLGIVVALQVLGNGDEDTRRQGHVEYPVRLGTTLLDFLQVLLEIDERFVLVVLSRHICAETAELLQLLL